MLARNLGRTITAGAVLLAFSGPDRAIGQARAVNLFEAPIGRDWGTARVVEPHIVASPDDPAHLVGAAILADPNRGIIVTFNSRDGGRSWTRVDLPTRDGLAPHGDPWLAWLPDGSIHLVGMSRLTQGESTRAFLWVYRSDDGGASWEGPVQLPMPERGSYDHPVLAAAPEPRADPVLYAVSTVGLSALAVLRHTSPPAGSWDLNLYRPDDLNNNLGSAVALGPETLVFTYFDMSTRSPDRPLWAVRTTDGGATFDRVLIRRGIVPWGFPMLAADYHSSRAGRIYAVWLQADGDGGNDVRLGFSDDQGQTWGDSTVVNSAGGSVFRGRPYAAVSKEGVVGVAWDDRRHATGDSCSDVYFAASLDGGASFLPEIRVSSTTACAHTPGNGPIGERYIMGGDYGGVATTADGAFQIVWSDARSGRFLPYTARVRIDR